MSRINELKVFYYLTEGPRRQKIYKDSEYFFIRYHLEPNQTRINLNLLKRIISTEINPYLIKEFRILHPTKHGYLKITDNTFFPISKEKIYLQIQLKEPEPEELIQLEKIKKDLEAKIKYYEEIKNKIKEVVDDKKIDLFFLYAFPMEETENTELNSIITYHLEIGKLDNLYKNSKKGFNAIYESCNSDKLEDAIRAMPRIIHISCHGKEPGKGYALVLEDKGNKFELTKQELEKKLKNLTKQLSNIDLVVLSSCYSEIAGKLFYNNGAKNVICIDENFPISNTASLNFAISFYQKLIDCKSIRDAFKYTIDELTEQDKKIKNDSKCCCYVHEHRSNCCLKNENLKETIHKLFHADCNCHYKEFNRHSNSCSIIASAKSYNKSKNKNRNEKIFIEEDADSDTSIICCGCDKNKKYMHYKGETFKFILKSKNDKIIYGENKDGDYKKNKNCYVVQHLSDYKDNFLFLIERRDKVKQIADIIRDENSAKHFIIIHGEKDIGKFNFAKSTCIYLFERNIINNFYIKRTRSIDGIKELIDRKFEEGKYVFIIEIDVELQTPINLIDEILNEKRFFDNKFYFFILLRTTKDKIEINPNGEKYELIPLTTLSPPKALQLLGELSNVHSLKKNYLTDDQLGILIAKKKFLRKEMLPLLKIINAHDNFESVCKELDDTTVKRSCSKTDINNLMEKAGNIIFLLYIMDKGLPLSVLLLYDPNFENIINKSKKSDKYFCRLNHNNWKISKSEIHYDDITPVITDDKRKELVEKCLEIFAKLLFHLIQKNHKVEQQNYFNALDNEFYFDYFFENEGFWKTFNQEKYEECFKKDKNYDVYKDIISKNEINLEDTRDNIYNLLETNMEAINKLYSENDNTKEYLEQILIMLPRLFMKKESEIKNILKKSVYFIKKMKEVNPKNILRLNLFSIMFYENIEINSKEFDNLETKEQAYASFINGIRINHIIYKYFRFDNIGETKKSKLEEDISAAIDSFETAKNKFENNTMKAHCYYHIGNVFYKKKKYKEAEKNYKNGKSLKNISEYIKGRLNLKLAKLFIENIHNDANNKQKFEEIIQDILNMKDIRFINEGKELKKEMEEKFLPDIIMLNSNPLIREENFTLYNNKIQANPNNQYYLMNKLYDRNDINTNLIIKYQVLNEENMREAFSGKGKILILQSDDFNDAGDIFLESYIGKSYSVPNKYFSRFNKINYDILILCFINSDKSIEALENKFKFLITFDSSVKSIFNDIGNKAILEYNKLSIDFLEHFIVNITSKEIKQAFDEAYKTFEYSFKRFCKKNTDSLEYEKIKFINLIINPQNNRNKKNTCIINKTGKKNIQFIPYPLLKEPNLKFSINSDLNNDISQIIKIIMQNYEDNYYDIVEKKKKSIEMNIIKENDESVQIFEKTSFTTKQLVVYEIMRFLFRHHFFFNSLLFRYYKSEKYYMNDLLKLKKLRDENSSGLGVIVIKLKKEISKNNYIEILPRFLYLYLLNAPATKKAINYTINNKIKKNNNDSDDDYDNKKNKNKKKIKSYNSSKKVKHKNSDRHSSSKKSKGNLKLEKNNPNSKSNYAINKVKLKEFIDTKSDFLVFEHDNDSEDEDDKDNDDNYFSDDD